MIGYQYVPLGTVETPTTRKENYLNFLVQKYGICTMCWVEKKPQQRNPWDYLDQNYDKYPAYLSWKTSQQENLSDYQELWQICNITELLTRLRSKLFTDLDLTIIWFTLVAFP